MSQNKDVLPCPLLDLREIWKDYKVHSLLLTHDQKSTGAGARVIVQDEGAWTLILQIDYNSISGIPYSPPSPNRSAPWALIHRSTKYLEIWSPNLHINEGKCVEKPYLNIRHNTESYFT